MMEEGKQYYYRLNTLVVDLGTEVLLNYFKTQIPAGQTVSSFLKNEKSTIQKLKKKKVFTDMQLNILNATNLDESKLDISLLYTLLRNLTSIQEPSGGWTIACPAPYDTTPGAFLMRLKMVRNEAIAHRSKRSMEKSEFEKFWKEAEVSLVKLAGEISPDEELAVRQKVDEVKTKRLVGDEKLKEDKLMKWELEEKLSEMASKLDNINDKVNKQGNLTEDVSSMKTSLVEMQDKLKKLEARTTSGEQVTEVTALIQQFQQIKKQMDLYMKTMESRFYAPGMIAEANDPEEPPIDNKNALSKDEIEKYARELGSDWDIFAIYLGYRQVQVDALKETYAGKIEVLHQVMLEKWHNVVARCNENPKRLLAAAFSGIKDNLTASDILESRDLLPEVKKLKPQKDTAEKIKKIRFSRPVVYAVQPTVNHNYYGGHNSFNNFPGSSSQISGDINFHDPNRMQFFPPYNLEGKLKMAKEMPGVLELFLSEDSKKTEIKNLPIGDLIEMGRSRQLNVSDDNITDLQKCFIEMPKHDKRQYYTCAERYKIPEELEDWQSMGETLIKEGTINSATEQQRTDADIKMAQVLNEKIALWKGDITNLEVDVIVNSTSSILLEPRSGVSGAISYGAGPILDYELRKIWHTYGGDVVYTAGYCLPATYIFHTSGPSHDWEQWDKTLRSCYKNALDKMKELRLKTLAFCCIATAKGIDNRASARIALETTHDWLLENHAIVDKIVFCIFEDFQMDIYKESIQEISPVVPRPHTDKTNLPPEILRMDSRSKDLYIRALAEGKTEVHSIRAMVVGHFDVGKTTLTKRMLGEDVDIDERNSTEGIEVHVKRCRVSLETGQWEIKPKGLHRDDSSAHLAKVVQEISVISNSELSSLDTNPELGFNEKLNLDASANADDMITKDSGNLIASPSGYDESEAKLVEPDQEHVSFTREGTEGPGLSQSRISQNDTPIRKEIKLLVQNREELRDINNYADLSIWDFAGQYAFYSTHQIFLSRRAVYLLVIDLSKHIDSLVQDDACIVDAGGEKRMKISEFVEFWLESIHFYTKEKKTVILVGTRLDILEKQGRRDDANPFFDKLRRHLIGKPFSICLSEHQYAVNNSITDSNLEHLKSAIFEVAKSKNAFWGEAIPAKWLPLERELVNRKSSKIIGREELKSLNHQLCLPLDDGEELDLFLRFQHECGLILYFSEESLKDYIVLDPQWLIDAFKCFITSEMFMKRDTELSLLWEEFKEKRILTQDFIDQSWKHSKDKQFSEHKDHLLGLMERLDIISRPISFADQPSLCHRESKIRESYYFIPCMLKDQPPRDILNTNHTSNSTSTSKLCYKFNSEFISPAIFHRLLAACMAKWEPRVKNRKTLLFCGCGVFNLDKSGTHQVTLYLRENYIQIWVTRFGSRKGDKPEKRKCTEVRDQVEGFLRKFCDHMTYACSDIETFIKCPNSDPWSSAGMINLEILEEHEEYCCSDHEEEHTIWTSDICSCWTEGDETSPKVPDPRDPRAEYQEIPMNHHDQDIKVPGNIHSGVSGNDSIMATGVFSARELMRVTRPLFLDGLCKDLDEDEEDASIMMPPNGIHPMLPHPKIDSPSYYQYSPHPQDPSQHMVGMSTHHSLPNGQSQLSPSGNPHKRLKRSTMSSISPSGNPHKRLKRSTMSSISSTEDDQESIGDDTEQMTSYYKAPSGMRAQPPSWQDPNMDPVRQEAFLDRIPECEEIATMSLRIGYEWKQIGLQLGLTVEIEHAEMDNITTKDRICSMLQKWKEGGRSTTFRDLKKAIIAANGDVSKIFKGFE